MGFENGFGDELGRGCAQAVIAVILLWLLVSWLT